MDGMGVVRSYHFQKYLEVDLRGFSNGLDVCVSECKTKRKASSVFGLSERYY